MKNAIYTFLISQLISEVITTTIDSEEECLKSLALAVLLIKTMMFHNSSPITITCFRNEHTKLRIYCMYEYVGDAATNIKYRSNEHLHIVESTKVYWVKNELTALTVHAKLYIAFN